MLHSLVSNAVDPKSALLYRWEARNRRGRVIWQYVGRSKSGIRRALRAYERSVERMQAGLPYRKGNPDGFRWVHQRMVEALDVGHRLRLTLLENVPVGELVAAEKRWQEAYGCPASYRR